MSEKKKSKITKENENLRNILYRLVQASERVSKKYGTDDDGVPSDWSEWVELRIACQNARGEISP